MASTAFGKLHVELTATSARFKRDMEQAKRSVSSFRETVNASAKSMLTLNNVARAGAAAAAIGYTAKQVFDLGARVEETGSKFDKVFAENAESVQAFLNEYAEIAGLSAEQAQAVTATTGAMLQGFGFARDAAADLSMQVTELAADLASFNNLPIEETTRAVQAALTGEKEQLKRLGIAFLDVDVKQRAMINSGKKNASQITRQEKALATFQLIAESAGVAVGDARDTMDSNARTAERLSARFGTLAETMSTRLNPMFQWLLRNLDEATEGMSDMQAGGDTAARSFAVLAQSAITAFRTLKNAVTAPINALFKLIVDFAAATVDVLSVIPRGLQKMFPERFDTSGLDGAVTYLRGVSRRFADATVDDLGDIQSAWADLLTELAGGPVQIGGEFGDILPDADPTQFVGMDTSQLEAAVEVAKGKIDELDQRIADSRTRLAQWTAPEFGTQGAEESAAAFEARMAAATGQATQLKDRINALLAVRSREVDALRTINGLLREKVELSKAEVADPADLITGGLFGNRGGGDQMYADLARARIDEHGFMVDTLSAQSLGLTQALAAHAQVPEDAWQGSFDATMEASRIASDHMAGFFEGALSAATNGFKSFADYAVQQLKRIAIQAAALKIFEFITGGPVGPGGFMKRLFAGGFHKGGSIGAGQFGIVGERGPEIVRGPANVTGTNDTAAAMSQPITIVFQSQDGRELHKSVTYQQERGTVDVRSCFP